MKQATLLFGALALFFLLISSANADVPTQQEMRRIMLMNFASWCGNLGITPEWDCFPCKEPELQGFVLDGKVLNRATVMFAYMGHFNDTIWVVIRGTVPTSAVSWIINDIPIIPVPFVSRFRFAGLNTRAPFVAAGFLSAWKSIERPLLALMANATNFCPQCNKVIITGHSLGAAVASFASIYASETMGIPKERITLITSGGPRTGNRAFARDVQDSVGEIYRVVFGGDIVTQLPAWTGPIGFHHFPTEILILENGTHKVCSRTNGEDFSCANGLVFQPWRFINVNHFLFGGVMAPNMYARMIAEEPPMRWCGVANSNSPGLGMVLATSDYEEENAIDNFGEENFDNNFAISDEDTYVDNYDENFVDNSFAVSDEENFVDNFDNSFAIQDDASTQQAQAQQRQSYDFLSAGPAFVVGMTLFVGVLAVFGFGYVIVTLSKKKY